MNKLGIVALLSIVMIACDNDDDSLRPSLNTNDKQFVEDAARTNATLAAFGNLALERSQNMEVHYFAQAMIDHDAQNDLSNITAVYDNVELKRDMDPQHQGWYDELKNLEGDAFDEAYINLMIEDHVDAIKLFESQIDKCKADNVKNYSLKYLPHLKEHRDRALILQNRLLDEEEQG